MNIYIMVDIEGISGIYCKEQTLNNGSRFNEGREYMTREVNVCVEACKEAGAEKVFVRDAHGQSCSLKWEKLSPLADYYICGNTQEHRFVGIEECDGVILLGYHAMAGTAGGVLEHSMSSTTIQNYWINGQLAGEIAIDAGIVGDKGKPVIMISGDDKVCKEAKALMPLVVTAEVKKGITWSGSMLLPAEKAYEIIRTKTKEAISKLSTIRPLVYDKPINLRVECVERNLIPGAYSKPYMKIIDGRTYEVTGLTMEETLCRT